MSGRSERSTSVAAARRPASIRTAWRRKLGRGLRRRWTQRALGCALRGHVELEFGAWNSGQALTVAHRTVGNLDAMLASLEGLSLGDAFGERMFGAPRGAFARELPSGPWRWTDDTHMALSVARVLAEHGRVDQDALAAAFAAEYRREPWRGYAKGAVRLLEGIRVGLDWRDEAPALFGQGSYGNGGAMRVAPLGAFFAGEPARAAREAAASAAITHAHPEGIHGAIAVAVGASLRAKGDGLSGSPFLEGVAAHVPAGETRSRIERARALAGADVQRVASELGCGYEVTAFDTVPFCLWVSAFHEADFGEALWQTLAPGGDRDTTCAIVGGILAADRRTLPAPFLREREPLPAWTARVLARNIGPQ